MPELTALEKAQRLLNREDKDFESMEEIQNITLNDFVLDAIKSNAYSTLHIRYSIGNVYVICDHANGKKLEIFKDYREDSYNEFCAEVLDIDQDEEYNCSRTKIIEGIRTRIFALMRPFVKTPSVTISTTKIPPETLTKQTISDELFDEIVHSNFIIVGKSGSGKSVHSEQIVSIQRKNKQALIKWKDLQIGDVFSSGEKVIFIADWEERPCFTLKIDGQDELAVSDEHLIKVKVFDHKNHEIPQKCVLGDQELIGWNNVDMLYQLYKDGFHVLSDGKEMSIEIYDNGKPQKVRCIQTDKGTYTINGIVNHNTYLTNYLLNKFIKDNESIALIEEFGELIPPNDLTESIVVPPPKPGNESLLKFVTEQSNLMRLDAIYVGEIKGAEAWPFVVNLASGTRGGCTLHGDSAVAALNRLRALCRLSCDNDEAIIDFIAKSIDYIIVMKNKNIETIQKLTGTHLKNNFTMDEVSS